MAGNPSFPLWPGTASGYAHQVDWLTWSFTALQILLILPVVAALLIFIIKYRRGSPARRDRTITGAREVGIEIAWMGIPFALTLIFFAWGAWLFYRDHRVPPDAMEIDVVAKQWMWQVQYPGGQREIDSLHIPRGRPVKLVMISEDVIHSLYLPALRLKQDVLPDRYTTLWFVADRAGTYPLRCAEFCGDAHSRMIGTLTILPPAEYQAWLDTQPGGPALARAGEALFRQYGCSGCHGAAATVHAPPLEGVFGSPVPLADGSLVTADERYLHDSIVLPEQQVVAGYAPIMPSFAQLPEADILKLVAYLKSLAAVPPASREARP